MNVAIIVAGAADMYCGSCLKDSALATGLRRLGHGVTVVPTYTPLRLDGEPTTDDHVFFGGIEVYLAEKVSMFRSRRGAVARLLGAQRLLRWLGSSSVATDPRKLGGLTCSVLRGEEGRQAYLLEELVEHLAVNVRPDIVQLPNSLYVGFARRIKERLRVPVVCGLTGGDLFLSRLQGKHRTAALRLVGKRSLDVDAFVAASAHCKAHMSAWVGLDPEKIHVVLPGIALEDFAGMPSPRSGPLTIGYLSRLAPEKGLHHLARAFERLCRSGEFPDVRLKVAGYLGRGEVKYVAAIRHALATSGVNDRVDLLGTVERAQKLDFLRQIDVLSVPTDYPEPKGLFVFEALAAGVPVVLPSHGAFPEHVEQTGGGLLHEPRSAKDLAEKLATILRDHELRRRLGASGQAAVHSRFSSEVMVEKTLDVYARLLDGAKIEARD